MKRIAVIIISGLLAGNIFATFELQDPAAQIYEEEKVDASEKQEALGETEFCVIEVEDGVCFCIHKETKDRFLLTEDRCAAILSKAEKVRNP